MIQRSHGAIYQSLNGCAHVIHVQESLWNQILDKVLLGVRLSYRLLCGGEGVAEWRSKRGVVLNIGRQSSFSPAFGPICLLILCCLMFLFAPRPAPPRSPPLLLSPVCPTTCDTRWYVDPSGLHAACSCVGLSASVFFSA